MHNIKVSKQSTKEEKQRKRLTHIQTETKPNTKILNKKTEQPQQQNKTKLENKNENHIHADKSSNLTPSNPVLLSNLKKKQTKMSQQKNRTTPTTEQNQTGKLKQKSQPCT